MTDRPGPDRPGADWLVVDGLAGLLLAAGAGRRMGIPKGLVELDGQPLAERGVQVLADAGCDPVIVVVGARGDDIRTALAACPQSCQVVHNPDWRTGMASSLRTGLAALPAEAAAVVILLVDQPGITAESVHRLAAAWRGGAVAAVATYHGRPRNPVLLDRSLFADVADTVTGDAGARVFLRTRPDLVTHVACEDVADPFDIDVEADLTAARQMSAADSDKE